MADTAETFRQGAIYYRNAMDWAKKQRDEVIRQANERAGECQAGTLAVDASFGQASLIAGRPTGMACMVGWRADDAEGRDQKWLPKQLYHCDSRGAVDLLRCIPLSRLLTSAPFFVAPLAIRQRITLFN